MRTTVTTLEFDACSRMREASGKACTTNIKWRRAQVRKGFVEEPLRESLMAEEIIGSEEKADRLENENDELSGR